jgi:hypothetical protein
VRAPWDVVALVFGLLLSGVAVAALWLSFTGSLNWSVLRTATPLALVAVGGLGLALSRRS